MSFLFYLLRYFPRIDDNDFGGKCDFANETDLFGSGYPHSPPEQWMDTDMDTDMMGLQGGTGGGGGGGEGEGEGERSGGKRKKRKKQKDPAAPKHAKNSYMFFRGEEWKKQKEAHPEYV